MDYYCKFLHGESYHVYNRGNGSENLFVEHKNYGFFLHKLFSYVDPVAEIYAYCLLGNHFHLLLQIRPIDEISENSKGWCLAKQIPFRVLEPSFQIACAFNSYSKAVNKMYGRHGSLFQKRCKRIQIRHELHLLSTIAYIHTNAQHHGMVKNFLDWPYSSYGLFLEPGGQFMPKQKVLTLFDGADKFIRFHQQYVRNMICDERTNSIEVS